MSGQAPDDDRLTAILRSARDVAVVGLSPRPDRPSHAVAAYLQGLGYRILPVNPAAASVLGVPSYPDLAALPLTPDIVCVFRRPADVPPVAGAAVRRGAPVLWLQLGITHPEAEAAAAAAGLTVVSDRCMMVEHRRLLGTDR